MRKSLKIALPILVLAVALSIAALLKVTKPVSPATPAEERTWAVETVAARIGDQTPELLAYGEIIADREADLRALVTGPVVEISERFRDGEPVTAGTVLVQIDPFDFELEVVQAKAAAAEARAALAELEARLAAEQAMLVEDENQAEIAGRDVARREKLGRDVVSERALDQARDLFSKSRNQAMARGQQITTLGTQIEQARIAIERLDAAAKRAQRHLDDTQLKAPFDGVLADTAAERGQRLNAGDRVARLVDPTELVARFFLSAAHYASALAGPDQWRDRPVTVIWSAGGEERRYVAKLARVDGEIDTDLGGLYAYARLTGLDNETELRPGAFVSVALNDRTYPNTARLPEPALHRDDTVYVVAEDRLEARTVSVVARAGTDVLVAGDLADGDPVVVTRFNEIGPGVKVRAVP